MKKTFFLTGSARGLGRSLTAAILAAGHQLVATARKPEQLDEFVQRYGAQILPLTLDITDYAAAQQAVQRGIDTFGRLDVVINNAGFGVVGAVEDLPMADIRAQLDTNFLGSIHIIKAVLPHLRTQGAGRIIQIGSIGGRIATAGAASYYATKWALAGFLDSLALEVNPLGIHVTVVEPGGMRTDFAEDSSLKVVPSHPAYDATVKATGDMMKSPAYAQALGDPAKVAELVLKVAELPSPPQRLLVGSGTYQYGTGADHARAEADAQWQWLSESVDA